MDHPNFYENVKEAEIRLLHSVVMYDQEPYYVIALADHKPDGIIRVYMDRLGNPDGMAIERLQQVPYEYPVGGMGAQSGYAEDNVYSKGHNSRGAAMDWWLEKHPTSGIIRKMMNSPSFNKFRPFPLGMVNFKGSTIYMERQPLRNTQQGLTQQMLYQHGISINKESSGGRVPFTGESMYEMIKGVYPDAKVCIKAMNDPDISNEAIAFSRHFAFVRGPIDSLFLAYKQEVIGIMPSGDTSRVILGKKFRYTKEVVENLKLFESIEA